MVLRDDGQAVVVDGKGERLELLLADMQGVDLADGGVLVAFADDQHRFRLVAHLRTDMPAHVVVALVQVKHAMDMQVEFRRPLHHLVDDLHRLSRAVDVEHQVTDAVDDDQPVPLVLAQGIVDHLYADGRRVFPETDEIEVLAVGRGRQPGKPQDAFQHVVAVETALLRVHVQDAALALGQVGVVIQYLPVGQRRGDDSRDIECLFRLRLAGRGAEIAERGYGGVVYPDDLGRSLVSVRGPYL
ncbi:hypothetical protein BACFIN_05228 [Bacteroides finegoldii DSM 17565]|nr:hypothetical protein BACFIN_05228 [Bacteroides finegoldii DSM 17565]